MKLFNNRPSPYGRKVLVAAHEKQLLDRIEIVQIDPWSDPPELLAAAPAGKVPALLTDDGRLITESTTIATYFDEIGPGPALIGTDAWDTLARTALAQGLIDATFASVIERRRPPQLQWSGWLERQQRAIERLLGRVTVRSGRFDLGDLSLACGLAYMDFRLPSLGWRTGHPQLATWLDGVAERPSMRASAP